MIVELLVLGIMFLLLMIILIYQIARVQNTLKQIFEVEARKLAISARKDLIDMALNVSEVLGLNKPLHALINKITERIDNYEKD